MTYCVERTNLLRRAGRTLATDLLPKPFLLWYSDHDTGCQMTIVAPAEDGRMPLPVWKGSIWHSSIYEFNDRDDIGGLQPDFAFAKDAIEAYFTEVAAEVSKREKAAAERRAERAREESEAKQRAIEDVRRKISCAVQ
jgi:hypothetical protein